MIDELDALARDSVRNGRLTGKGQARAEFIARAMKGKTAAALAVLYAEVAKLAGRKPKHKAAKRPGRKGGEK